MNQPPEHDEGDLEQYAGEVIVDPWLDPEKKNWPMNEEVDDDGLGSGGTSERSAGSAE